eukprot:SAG31_NODE_1910_length_6945_cov_45.108384_4_plen_147_part_00
MLVGLARASKHNKLRCAVSDVHSYLSSTGGLGVPCSSSRGSTSPDEDQSLGSVFPGPCRRSLAICVPRPLYSRIRSPFCRSSVLMKQNMQSVHAYQVYPLPERTFSEPVMATLLRAYIQTHSTSLRSLHRGSTSSYCPRDVVARTL